MPPKKKTKATTTTAEKPPATRRSTRVAPVLPEANSDITNGKRKRDSNPKAIVLSDGDSDSEEPEPVPVKQRKSTAKSTVSKASTKMTKAPSKDIEPMNKAVPSKKGKSVKKMSTDCFSAERCEKWFLEHANDAGEEIDGGAIGTWLETLGVHPEGAGMYVILHVCKATSTMTITKSEFMAAMSNWKIDSNEKLKTFLPFFFQQVAPAPVYIRPDNTLFLEFYKWCFAHFKGSESAAKNITFDVAVVLFSTLLDCGKYRLDWTSSESSDNDMENGAPRLNHVNVFVEYLNGDNDKQPVAVITRDQYEQFYHFNKDVPWDLKGYSELTSTWPTLLDNYIIWKKEKYPTPSSEEQ